MLVEEGSDNAVGKALTGASATCIEEEGIENGMVVIFRSDVEPSNHSRRGAMLRGRDKRDQNTHRVETILLKSDMDDDAILPDGNVLHVQVSRLADTPNSIKAEQNVRLVANEAVGTVAGGRRVDKVLKLRHCDSTFGVGSHIRASLQTVPEAKERFAVSNISEIVISLNFMPCGQRSEPRLGGSPRTSFLTRHQDH